MDLHRDPTASVADRVRDLVGRMTLEEKAGELFQQRAEAGPDGALVEEGALFLGAQSPVLRDVEERRERGGAELFGVQIRSAGRAGLQHLVKSDNGVIVNILQ